MEQHIRLIVLEHLCDQFDIHVLYVDLLQIPIHHHDGFVQLLNVRDDP